MGQSASISAWRRRGLPLAIGCALAALGALAFELYARWKLGPRFVFGVHVGSPQSILGEFDAELGWRNRCNASATIALGAGEYRVTLNSRGERGPERALEKRPGVKRVLVLGDSTAWGWGVDDAQTWTRLVERELGSAVELVNLAVPGYGTDQELWVLEREAPRHQPDLVLLGFVHNDTLYNGKSDMQGMGKPMFARAADGTWSVENRPVPEPTGDAELAKKRARRLAAMYLASVKLFEPAPAQPTRYDLANPKVQQGIERYWDGVLDPATATHHALEGLSSLCRERQVPLVVFHFPHLVDRWLYDPGTAVPPHAGDTPYETYGTRTLAEAGRRLGFATFSIDAALLEVVSTGVDLDCGDEHLNARGNEIVAGVVSRELRARLGL